MGLFDDLKCEYPLPDSNMQDHAFQTKSLDNRLDQYRITKDGRLMVAEYRLDPIPESERKHFLDCTHRVELGERDTQYHGDIVFYAFEDRYDNSDMIEYQARFTDGQLQWIKRWIATDATGQGDDEG